MVSRLIDFIFKRTSVFYHFRNFIHNNFKEEKKILRKEFDKDKKTLDFGCGIGQYSYLFNDYLGVDIDKDNIEFARNKFNRKFQVIENISDIKEKKFDQVFSTMTLHHISDKELMIIFNEISKLLNKNGKLLIIDHIEVGLQKNPLGRFILMNDRGEYFRNVDKLKNLFDKYFRITKLYYYKTGPFRDYVLILNKK
ncbi:class I SAM-dependent methyltransferase [Candidatus Woesearchaeota archaeon]|nr:class I SAM-dependent methyltransferase [Candidatus Woesearchaeota archaeon]